MTDEKRIQPKPDAEEPRLKQPKDAVKDLEAEPKSFEDVRGGASCADGEHIKKATITVR